MTQTIQASIIREGFGYLEDFRWHNNELWFSDSANHKVFRMGLDARSLKEVTTVNGKPSSLGFPKDEAPLVVVMDDNSLRRI